LSQDPYRPSSSNVGQRSGTKSQPDAAIVAEGLVKRYGEVEAVKGVSFQVPEGQVLGLLGPNGAGKTTSVRILTTLTRPDAGHASVLGIDVVREPGRVRSMIGLAGQYAALDENLTARENLRLVGRLAQLSSRSIALRSDELLPLFKLDGAADRVVRTFSGGMRRRLDLAAALLHEPPVVFLDEPTTGLDPQGRKELWTIIRSLVGQGSTVLLTTQYLEEADTLADNVVVIDHGGVIAEGTPTQLKSQLGATVIEVGFHDPVTAGSALAILSPLGETSQEGDTVHIQVPVDAQGARAMFETVRALGEARLEPSELVLREPTLDDVFLALTGHTATTDEQPAGGPEPSGDGRQSS
jgi:ABC-2 type transport system ATP-binding protein